MRKVRKTKAISDFDCKGNNHKYSVKSFTMAKYNLESKEEITSANSHTSRNKSSNRQWEIVGEEGCG